MIDIIITTDYEVFGNGSGNIRYCLIDPTNELLEICNAHDVRLTLFFEICEYWAFKKDEAYRKEKDHFKQKSLLMERQAVEAVKNGHDVQLHLHPQWIGSQNTEHGWELNYNYTQIAKMPHGLGAEDDRLSIRGLLSQGKTELEDIIKPHFPDYECLAFRAGATCIQPSRDVVEAMRGLGIKADSSVYKGGYFKNEYFDFDFRDAFSNYLPWRVDPNDINRAVFRKQNNPVWEIPIYSIEKRRIRRLTIERFFKRILTKPERIPPGCDGRLLVPLKDSENELLPWKLFGYLREKMMIQWDFCNLTAGEMWGMLKNVIDKKQHHDRYIPLVMMGHSKAFNNSRELILFLQRVKDSKWYKKGEIRFSTMRQAVTILTET